MYVMVIKGKVRDRAAFAEHVKRLEADVLPGAIGFLGSTIGVADDGTFVAIVRFEDEASATANAARPERQAWMQETERLLDGPPTVRQSADTSTLFDGGSDKAGFVQVMEGTADRAQVEALESPEMLEGLRTARPDLLGGLRVWFEGGAYLEVAYFTSEEDARKGEASAEFADGEAEYTAAFGEMTFIDLPDPIFH